MAEDPPKGNGWRVSDETREKVKSLLADWRVWLTETCNQVETFTREKPATGLSLAFLAGFVLGGWARKRK